MFGTYTTGANGAVNAKENRMLRRTVATAGSGGKRLLHPGLWRKVHVDPLPFSELKMLSRELYPSLPEAIINAALQVFRRLDRSGRIDLDSSDDIDVDDESPKINQDTTSMQNFGGGSGRHSSVRDLVKLLGRISSSVHFEPGVTFCTESQRILCMAESFDVFAGWNPCEKRRRDFITCIPAPS